MMRSDFWDMSWAAWIGCLSREICKEFPSVRVIHSRVERPCPNLLPLQCRFGEEFVVTWAARFGFDV